MICRYYARLLAPFILSPVENQRKVKEINEGDLAEHPFVKALYLLSILCFWTPEKVSI
jgi:hypothetical protein